MTIETGVPGVVGAGVGVGLVGVEVEEDPQPNDRLISSATRVNEQRMGIALTKAGPRASDDLHRSRGQAGFSPAQARHTSPHGEAEMNRHFLLQPATA